MLCVIHTCKTANVSIELVRVLLAFKCELTRTSQNKDIIEIIPDHCMLKVQARLWACGREERTVGQDCQKCKETSNTLADKQQKRGEHVENIKFS